MTNLYTFWEKEPTKFGRKYRMQVQTKTAVVLAVLIKIMSPGEHGIAQISSPVHTSSGKLVLGSQQVSQYKHYCSGYHPLLVSLTSSSRLLFSSHTLIHALVSYLTPQPLYSLGGRCWDIHSILESHLCFKLRSHFKSDFSFCPNALVILIHLEAFRSSLTRSHFISSGHH